MVTRWSLGLSQGSSPRATARTWRETFATKPEFKVSFEEVSHFEPLRPGHGPLRPGGATRTVVTAREQAGARATGAPPRGLPVAKATGHLREELAKVEDAVVDLAVAVRAAVTRGVPVATIA